MNKNPNINDKKWIITFAHVWNFNIYEPAKCDIRYDIEADRLCNIEFFDISNVMNVRFDRIGSGKLVIGSGKLVLSHLRFIDSNVSKVGCINGNEILFKDICDFQVQSLDELMIKLELEGYLYDDPCIRQI